MASKPLTIPNVFASEGTGTPNNIPLLDADFTQVANYFNDGSFFSTRGTDSGAVNAYVVTLPTGYVPSAYNVGMRLVFNPGNTNTGASTINVNALGSQTILTANGAALVGGEITAGYDCDLVYDGTNFRILSVSSGQIRSAINPGIVFPTTTTNLAITDNGKYFVCSGGSWTLGLPAPALGLSYRVRNDMGITGTTGTITIHPASGTIDGVANLALLPGQEVQILTDGTNWRTFGRDRVVTLGTVDITSATSITTVLLPLGYRLFELDFAGLVSSVDGTTLEVFLSSDGGSTFITGYYWGYMINNTTSTVVAVSGASAAYGYIGQFGTNGLGGAVQLKIYPGTSSKLPNWLSQGQYYLSSPAVNQAFSGGGTPSISVGPIMNAAKFQASSGTINSMSMTVKGVV